MRRELPSNRQYLLAARKLAQPGGTSGRRDDAYQLVCVGVKRQEVGLRVRRASYRRAPSSTPTLDRETDGAARQGGYRSKVGDSYATHVNGE